MLTYQDFFNFRPSRNGLIRGKVVSNCLLTALVVMPCLGCGLGNGLTDVVENEVDRLPLVPGLYVGSLDCFETSQVSGEAQHPP